MKAIVTIRKSYVTGKESLIQALFDLCTYVEDNGEFMLFHPKPKANMNFICLLLNDDIPYILTIENSIEESVKSTNGQSKSKK